MQEAKMDNEYKVIIIGGGPAGLAAGLYVGRSRINSLLIEKGLTGGLINNVEWIENYPGFPEGIKGTELGDLLHSQAIKYGLKTITAEVIGIELKGKQKIIKTTKDTYFTDAVIITTGSQRQKLGIPGEEEFRGRGVSYCAICDAAFYEGLRVAVVGGGNTAISEALHLAKFASQVTVIHRRDRLRATRVVQEKAFTEPKIKFMWDTVVDRIEGNDTVNKVVLRQVKTRGISEVEVDGIFISVGISPNTAFIKGLVALDDASYIITNDELETEIPGVFAAGDVRKASARQVITAVGDGATAAINVERYLTKYA